MRLLLIDTQSTGHHITYLQALVQTGVEVAVVVPTGTTITAPKVFHVDYWKNRKRNYLGWLCEINKIIRTWKPDVVHFVYGDDLYRYMGVGIGVVCRNCRSIVTFHQIRHSKLRDISKQVFAWQVDAVVVHTEQTKADLLKLGIKNVYHVEYPKFCEIAQTSKQTALEKLGLKEIDRPVLLALGGTRWEKGLDILLDALTDVKAPFHVLIAGKEQFFTREEIEKKVTAYAESVTLILEFLSDEKFSQCLNAADIVVLPYRKQFDGASGPLGEGVALGKLIVGANHGSLRHIIEKNHLGYTFETENALSLAKTLDKALGTQWNPDQTYLAYQKQLSPDKFKQEYLQIYSELIK